MRKLIISALLAYAVVIEMSLAQGLATKAETRVAEAVPSPAKVESKKAFCGEQSGLVRSAYDHRDFCGRSIFRFEQEHRQV